MNASPSRKPQALGLRSLKGNSTCCFRLLEKNKVDIFDIPIALILEQYVEFSTQCARSIWRLPASLSSARPSLLLIRSRMLLPNRASDDEEDPRAALSAALVEYRRAKAAATKLAELYEKHAGRYAREPDALPPSAEPPGEPRRVPCKPCVCQNSRGGSASFPGLCCARNGRRKAAFAGRTVQ